MTTFVGSETDKLEEAERLLDEMDRLDLAIAVERRVQVEDLNRRLEANGFRTLSVPALPDPREQAARRRRARARFSRAAHVGLAVRRGTIPAEHAEYHATPRSPDLLIRPVGHVVGIR